MALTLGSLSPAEAAEGLYLPPAPTGPGGADSITTSQGVQCSQSINSNSGYLDFGVAGGGGIAIGSNSIETDPTALGYARIIIPIGGQPERLDCSKLYKLEIERLQREIELLKIGLE